MSVRYRRISSWSSGLYCNRHVCISTIHQRKSATRVPSTLLRVIFLYDWLAAFKPISETEKSFTSYGDWFTQETWPVLSVLIPCLMRLSPLISLTRIFQWRVWMRWSWIEFNYRFLRVSWTNVWWSKLRMRANAMSGSPHWKNMYFGYIILHLSPQSKSPFSSSPQYIVSINITKLSSWQWVNNESAVVFISRDSKLLTSLT